MATRQVVDEGSDIGGRQVASRQGRRRSPAPACGRKVRRQPVQRILGEAAVCGELASQDVQQGRPVCAALQFEPVIPGDRGRRRVTTNFVERVSV